MYRMYNETDLIRQIKLNRATMYHYTNDWIYYNSVLCRICLYLFNSNVNCAFLDIPDDGVTLQLIKIVSKPLWDDFVQKMECHKLYKSHSFKMSLSNMRNL